MEDRDPYFEGCGGHPLLGTERKYIVELVLDEVAYKVRWVCGQVGGILVWLLSLGWWWSVLRLTVDEERDLTKVEVVVVAKGFLLREAYFRLGMWIEYRTVGRGCPCRNLVGRGVCVRRHYMHARKLRAILLPLTACLGLALSAL
jgi:hypothetical protein